MNLEQANYLGSGDRLQVLPEGLRRHGIETRNPVGTYVSQFDSPKHGRLVVVRLDEGETRGFKLDEVEILGRRKAG
jgi:hypothetical protein